VPGVGAAKVETDPIEIALVDRWALDYLARYASSAENLRRVLVRRIRRRSRDDVEAVQRATPIIDTVIERLRRSGLLDDEAYAAQHAQALHRRGASLLRISARLAAKGVPGAAATDALTALRNVTRDPDLAAACIFARRRRLGPYRDGGPDHGRDLAAFARAGFARRVAEAVLTCTDVDAVEALAREASGSQPG
jgi:regulatory protein